MQNTAGQKAIIPMPSAYGLSAQQIVRTLLSDALIPLVTRRATPGSKTRVLVVRLDNMGDFLLWLDAARGLRLAFPVETHHITLLGRESWSSLAEGQPYFDTVWAWDKERFLHNARYRRAQLREVRQAGFDVVVQARPWRDLLGEDAITRVSGAKARTGFARPDGGSRVHWLLSDRIYTQCVPFGAPEMMELQRNARLMQALGVKGFEARTPTLQAAQPLPPALAGLSYYVLFPGADWSGRRWPPERFAEIGRRIHAVTGCTGVVCGGPGDSEIARHVMSNPDVPMLDLTGRTTLPELARVMREARLVVSNETGGAHMAGAVGTECVCIVGGGHYGRFLPYRVADEGIHPLPVLLPMECFGCDWNCIFDVPEGDPTPCIQNVSVEMVWAQVLDILARQEVAAMSSVN